MTSILALLVWIATCAVAAGAACPAPSAAAAPGEAVSRAALAGPELPPEIRAALVGALAKHLPPGGLIELDALRQQERAARQLAEGVRQELDRAGASLSADARRSKQRARAELLSRAGRLAAEAQQIEEGSWSGGVLLVASWSSPSRTLTIQRADGGRADAESAALPASADITAALQSLVGKILASANAAPEATLHVSQDVGTSVRRAAARSVDAAAPQLTVLPDLPVLLDASHSSDEETPSELLGVRWLRDGRPLPLSGLRGELSADLLVGADAMSVGSDAPVCLRVEIDDGARVGAAQVELHLSARAGLSPVSLPVQVIERPHRALQVGLLPPRVEMEQQLRAVRLGVLPDRPDPSTRYLWTAASGPALRCDAIAQPSSSLLRCDDAAGFYAETSSPTLSFFTLRPGRYGFRAQSITQDLPSSEITLTTEAIFTRSSLNAGTQLIAGGGFRWIGSTSLPYMQVTGLGAGGLRYHAGVGAVVELSERTVEKALVEVGATARLAELASSLGDLRPDRPLYSGAIARRRMYDVQSRLYVAVPAVKIGDAGPDNIGAHVGLEMGPTLQAETVGGALSLVMAWPLSGEVRTPQLGVGVELSYRGENLARDYEPDALTREALSMARIARMRRHRCVAYPQGVDCGDGSGIGGGKGEQRVRVTRGSTVSKRWTRGRPLSFRRTATRADRFTISVARPDADAPAIDPAIDLDPALRRSALGMATALFPDIAFCLSADRAEVARGPRHVATVRSCAARPTEDAVFTIWRGEPGKAAATARMVPVTVELACTSCGARYLRRKAVARDVLPYLLEAQREADETRQRVRQAERSAARSNPGP